MLIKFYFESDLQEVRLEQKPELNQSMHFFFSPVDVSFGLDSFSRIIFPVSMISGPICSKRRKRKLNDEKNGPQFQLVSPLSRILIVLPRFCFLLGLTLSRFLQVVSLSRFKTIRMHQLGNPNRS